MTVVNSAMMVPSAIPAPLPAYHAEANRILMVTGALAVGGAERQMIALTHGLLARGYEVEIFEFSGVVPGQSSFASVFADMGVRSRRAEDVARSRNETPSNEFGLRPYASIMPDAFPVLCQALAATIAEFRPHVVHGWSDFTNVAGGFVATALGAPRVVLSQHTFPPPHWFDGGKAETYRQAYRALARNSSIVMSNNSGASLREYGEWLGIPAGLIHLVYNGFLPSSVRIRAPDERGECRAKLGLPVGVPTVGGMMRLSPEKDPDLWLETAALVAGARPDTRYVLAGYGHDDVAGRLRAKGDELGLGGRLVMTGAVTDTGLVYGALDLLLLSSRTENAPNVMIEAQAAGVPVVGPDVGGVGEVMIDQVTGLLVSERSAPDLAAAVLRILGDAAWRKHAETAGPAFVAGRFGQERMVAETIAVYG